MMPDGSVRTARRALSGQDHAAIAAIFVKLLCWMSILSCALGTSIVSAQSTATEWTLPANLSKTANSSNDPVIVADDRGYLHVLWSEQTTGTPDEHSSSSGGGDTIMYKRWDGQDWSAAVDIAYIPGENVATYVAATVDSGGRLHVVWSGQTNFYYTSAPIEGAHSAQYWSEPMVVGSDSARSQLMASIGADKRGNLYIAYATRGTEPGVQFIRSVDGGQTWLPSVTLSYALGELERTYSNVQLILDDMDRIHAVWTTLEQKGFGQAIYYTHSDDYGMTWGNPLLMAERAEDGFETGWPYMAFSRSGELVVVYSDGPSSVGRYFRLSVDRGESWTEPVRFLVEMEGLNGYVIPLFDSQGKLHVVVNMRTKVGQVVGLYYVARRGDDWSTVQPVAIDEPYADTMHRPSAVVRLGNEIHVVFWSLADSSDVWYLYSIIESVEPVKSNLVLKTNQELAASSSVKPVAIGAMATISDVDSRNVQASTLPTSPRAIEDGRPFGVEYGSVVSLLVSAAAALVIVMAGVKLSRYLHS